jgi:hypothetical protein
MIRIVRLDGTGNRAWPKALIPPGSERPGKHVQNPESTSGSRRPTSVGQAMARDWGCKMTLPDITLMAFTISNSVRVLAYAPQIWTAATDETGAKALSYSTWSLFLICNVTTAAYSVVNREDWALASMFLMNAVACAAILSAAAWRRSLHQRSQPEPVAANVIQLRPGRAA